MPSNMTRNKQSIKNDNHEAGLTRKKEERARREAFKKERKIETYLADDENFPSFAIQLQKIGLHLRDIPGDGNCLFRALGDQLEGHCRNHYRHRQDVVHYMVEHRTDFEPFIEDDVSFETHVNNLKKLGVYAGNDAIVAFARLHQVNVIIHQLNAKHLMINGGGSMSSRQLHVSYHNGDHYSSVRRLNDNTETPANVKIQEGAEENGDPFRDSRYGGRGYVRAVRGCRAIEEEVMAATNCTDLGLLRETLSDCDYDADAAIAHLLQMMEISDPTAAEDGSSGGPQQTPVGAAAASSASVASASVASAGDQERVLPESHTAERVYGVSSKNKALKFREGSLGGSSGYGSMTSNHGDVRPRLLHMQANSQYNDHTGSTSRLSSRKMKEIKRQEKKQRAEERHRQRVLGSLPTPPPAPHQTPVLYSSTSSFTFI